MDNIITIISSVGLSGLVSIVIVFLARTWISERLKFSIKHEYDVLLEHYKQELRAEHEITMERLRASNAESQAIQSLAMASFAEGHKAAIEKRLFGIENIWKEVISLRRDTPGIVTMLDILSPDEYQEFVTNPRLRTSVLTMNDPSEIFLSNIADEVRPFVGEYIYALFYAYRALSGRVVFLLRQGVDKGKVGIWFEDSGIQQLLNSVLNTDEIQQFNELRGTKFSWVRNLIEQKIIGQANRIISGEESSQIGLKLANDIVKTARELSDISSLEKENSKL